MSQFSIIFHLLKSTYVIVMKFSHLEILLLAFKPYISHSTPIFKDMKILQLEDLYTMQLYKFYYKNTNTLLPSYFSSFTPFHENHSHNCRYNILRLPMTRHFFFFLKEDFITKSTKHNTKNYNYLQNIYKPTTTKISNTVHHKQDIMKR